MPELPEVETVRTGLEKALTNRRIERVELRRNGLRSPFQPDLSTRLTGVRILVVRRRAKYLLTDLDSADVWLAHLGMSGSFRVIAKGKPFEPETHDHVVLTLDNGVRLIYNDPRRFGQMEIFAKGAEAEWPALSKIGPEPLDDTFDGPMLALRLKNKNTPIKVALLDQQVVAGIGNIYACEALYIAGIDPRKAARTIKGEKADRLAAAIKQVLRTALASGGSTLRDHRQLDGTTGYFQHAFAVYDHAQEPCAQCTCGGKATVRSVTQAGRTTFFCPVKQR
ncbi:MAG: bifunctional DNA-formamidopyrimidine glycosylase/DNA-(apurinic or apyrimidinic site) lyase [Alphaproteobacteria bacterium]|nr:bifunctional DNA-formamidopyrimidine glycosylase/DNA-(apurinic or apyrimidinic site) lyase [Alphaproteobacteria bacterium]